MTELQTLHWQIEQFLFREARLIDERKLDDWLDLWTMDCRYHVPVRHNAAPPVGEGLVDIESELDDDVSWIDDNKMLLFARVMRLRTGKAWSESPMARTRRLISNVEVRLNDDPAEYTVYSNMIQFRSRRDKQENWFVCQRRDLIVKTDDDFQIKQRHVVLDSTVLNSSYLTFI